MNHEKRNKMVRKWVKENGWIVFNFKTDNIVFSDGGLFSMQKEIVKKGHRNTDVLTANLWFGALDQCISNMMLIKKLLNDNDHKTNISYNEKKFLAPEIRAREKAIMEQIEKEERGEQGEQGKLEKKETKK